MYILGAFISLGFFLAIYLVIVWAIPEANKDASMLLLGVLGAKFSDVVSYFFGSSKGSADKTAIMDKNASKV
jgi:hypothetical protein